MKRIILPEDVAREIRWDINEARQFCLDLLTDCNDHTMCAEVKALFEPPDYVPDPEFDEGYERHGGGL